MGRFFAEVGLLVLHDAMNGAEVALPILTAHRERTSGRPPLSALALIESWVARDMVRADLLAQMATWPVLVCPAAVVPVGRTAEGLPIGVQVVGRPFEDHLVLDVAEAIERECGGYRPPPGFGEA